MARSLTTVGCQGLIGVNRAFEIRFLHTAGDAGLCAMSTEMRYPLGRRGFEHFDASGRQAVEGGCGACGGYVRIPLKASVQCLGVRWLHNPEALTTQPGEVAARRG